MADAYQLETTADRYLLEDGSGVYLLEGADAVFGDDSDGWWAGALQATARIALAGALAVNATAVQAQTRLNNSGDDFAPQSAATSVADTSQPSYRVNSARTSVVYMFGGDDFVPPQPAAFISDEDENAWPRFGVKPARVVPQPLISEDPLPIAAQEEGGTTVESASLVYSIGQSKTRIVYVYGDDVLPQQPVDAGDGLVWISIAPPYKAPLTPFIAEDFPPTAGVAVVPVGASEQPAYSIGQNKVTLRYVFGSSDELPSLSVPTFVFEDDPWPISTARQAAKIVQPYAYEDDLPIAASLAFEEDQWPVIPQGARQVRRWIDPVWMLPGFEWVLPINIEAHTFTGVLSVAPRFTGLLSLSPQFTGDASIDPQFGGAISVRPA